jgi:hypothetical protein
MIGHDSPHKRRAFLMGDFTGGRRVGGVATATRRTKARLGKAGPLTGARVRMIRGRRAGIKGVLEGLYLEGPPVLGEARRRLQRSAGARRVGDRPVIATLAIVGGACGFIAFEVRS